MNINHIKEKKLAFLKLYFRGKKMNNNYDFYIIFLVKILKFYAYIGDTLAKYDRIFSTCFFSFP